MATITLTTDFGDRDPYVGIMKGVILGIAPAAQIVDLTHQIPPQDIAEAAYSLQSAWPYFPAGTIHVAVVDPGVGSDRRPLLVTTDRNRFVGPDNGLFSFALELPGAQAWALDQPQYWRPDVSRTFHGRDIFAPVAAHLAAGIPPAALAAPISDPVRASAPLAERRGNGEIAGCVIHVDRFGNLITNVPGEWLAGPAWACEVAGQTVHGLAPAYAAAPVGALLLLIGSGGAVEIAARDGNAAARLDARRGTRVRLWTS